MPEQPNFVVKRELPMGGLRFRLAEYAADADNREKELAMATTAIITGPEFDALPYEEGRRWELLDGELMRCPRFVSSSPRFSAHDIWIKIEESRSFSVRARPRF
jgi:hypothetical protein